MASSLSLPSLRIQPCLESQFLAGEARFSLINSPYYRQSSRIPKAPPSTSHLNLKPMAKFNLSEVMGGRGLCNGERGLQLELEKAVEILETTKGTSSSSSTGTTVVSSSSFEVSENAFEKELLGLTGGFPGGEKGLQSFIEKNPPRNWDSDSSEPPLPIPSTKPKPPELPLLMPGMIAIVKNPNNPFYMYCGIVQRITDGKAGVLFEGGNCGISSSPSASMSSNGGRRVLP